MGIAIEVYSKPGCGKCKAAKDKLNRLGLAYTEHNIELYISHHEGWRQDGSADVMTAHTILDTLPLIRINGSFHNYPEAMGILKNGQLEQDTAVSAPALATA
jgi:glutaredoxin